jgi:hypothetical protein
MPQQYKVPVYGHRIKQVEVDFGPTPLAEKLFVITDSAVSANTHLTASIAYEAPTGKDLDELDMDDIDVKIGPNGDGQFNLFIRGRDGYLADKFKVNYIIG